jgi:hypothetical protein
MPVLLQYRSAVGSITVHLSRDCAGGGWDRLGPERPKAQQEARTSRCGRSIDYSRIVGAGVFMQCVVIFQEN